MTDSPKPRLSVACFRCNYQSDSLEGFAMIHEWVQTYIGLQFMEAVVCIAPCRNLWNLEVMWPLP